MVFHTDDAASKFWQDVGNLSPLGAMLNLTPLLEHLWSHRQKICLCDNPWDGANEGKFLVSEFGHFFLKVHVKHFLWLQSNIDRIIFSMAKPLCPLDMHQRFKIFSYFLRPGPEVPESEISLETFVSMREAVHVRKISRDKLQTRTNKQLSNEGQQHMISNLLNGALTFERGRHVRFYGTIGHVPFACPASQPRSSATSQIGWRWGEVSHFGSLGCPHEHNWAWLLFSQGAGVRYVAALSFIEGRYNCAGGGLFIGNEHITMTTRPLSHFVEFRCRNVAWDETSHADRKVGTTRGIVFTEMRLCTEPHTHIHTRTHTHVPSKSLCAIVAVFLVWSTTIETENKVFGTKFAGKILDLDRSNPVEHLGELEFVFWYPLRSNQRDPRLTFMTQWGLFTLGDSSGFLGWCQKFYHWVQCVILMPTSRKTTARQGVYTLVTPRQKCHCNCNFFWGWLQIVSMLGQHQKFCSQLQLVCSWLQMPPTIINMSFHINFCSCSQGWTVLFLQSTSSCRHQYCCLQLQFAVDVGPTCKPLHEYEKQCCFKSQKHVVLVSTHSFHLEFCHIGDKFILFASGDCPSPHLCK